MINMIKIKKERKIEKFYRLYKGYHMLFTFLVVFNFLGFACSTHLTGPDFLAGRFLEYALHFAANPIDQVSLSQYWPSFPHDQLRLDGDDRLFLIPTSDARVLDEEHYAKTIAMVCGVCTGPYRHFYSLAIIAQYLIPASCQPGLISRREWLLLKTLVPRMFDKGELTDYFNTIIWSTVCDTRLASLEIYGMNEPSALGLFFAQLEVNMDLVMDGFLQRHLEKSRRPRPYQNRYTLVRQGIPMVDLFKNEVPFLKCWRFFGPDKPFPSTLEVIEAIVQVSNCIGHSKDPHNVLPFLQPPKRPQAGQPQGVTAIPAVSINNNGYLEDVATGVLGSFLLGRNPRSSTSVHTESCNDLSPEDVYVATVVQATEDPIVPGVQVTAAQEPKTKNNCVPKNTPSRKNLPRRSLETPSKSSMSDHSSSEAEEATATGVRRSARVRENKRKAASQLHAENRGKRSRK